jgi:hypothetical protein
LDPVEALVEDLYHAAPGDLAMMLAAIQRHDYSGAMILARDLWGPKVIGLPVGGAVIPLGTTQGLSLVTIFRLMTYLRDQVVHPR